jgi:mono/diheme cytochrome c family protein
VGGDFGPKDPILAKTPAEQAKTFIMPPGYKLELVLADPDIISPAVVAFDGDGRMYVAELRSYMLDVDAGRQHEPTSRISVHESTKKDGVFDKHTVFADNLLFPRMILPLDNRVLTNETHSDDVLALTDTNGDGTADRREVFYSGVGSGRSGNVQQAQSGFVWGLDNWIYSTYNAFRFRWTPRGIVREPSGPPGAEWGMSMDDDGKIWLVNAAGERGPANFQIPIQYGAFMVPDQWEQGFEIPWGLPMPADMQGGLPRVRMPTGALAHFTSTTGPEVVRSDRYPADLNGDLLFPDPVGRFIRRAKIVKTEGVTQVRNAYPGAEFIVSSDPLFRPVNIKQGPDGALYIVDMYHGIIQDANWTARGTYLRYKVQQYQLDKVINHGRIWRLRFDGVPAGTAEAGAGQPAVPAIPLNTTWPSMSTATPAQLASYLNHPIGWWRDTAQRLLVLKQDKSVVPQLREIARTSDTLVGRFHAMWTLEGLGALDAALVREQMKDANPRMRIQALRASESLYKAGDRTFDADYRAAAKDADTDVAIQALLTLSVLKAPDLADVVKGTQAANSARGIKEIGNHLLAPAPVIAGGAVLSPEELKVIEEGTTTYQAVCASCHANDGRGVPLAGGAPGAMMAPSLAGSPRVNGHRDYVVSVLLKGLTGPLGEGTGSSADIMVPMGSNTDAWVASIASYVRSGFGNAGGLVTPADVARVRAATQNRRTPWTLKELEPRLPRRIEAQPTWRVTASHASDNAPIALSARAWNSGAPQAPGMWFQIELPQPTMITEVEFDSPAPTGRGGRGAAGGGAAGAGPVIPFPRGYRVEVSQDGKTWGKPVAEGKARGAHTNITFAPVRAKFVRITQTDTIENAPNWAMANVRLYEPGPGK